jgi:hypothetical protein
MQKHEKFLEFNGKKIIFLSVDGTYWIALKPICEALNIDANRSYQNAKNDPILGSELAIQQMQVSKNGKSQLRNVTCIPEQFVYGWIFSLRSDNSLLTEYKKTCYELLYNHFHGTITNRKELLLQKKAVETEIHTIKLSLKEQDENFKKLQQLEKEKKQIASELNSMDEIMIKQPVLFS